MDQKGLKNLDRKKTIADNADYVRKYEQVNLFSQLDASLKRRPMVVVDSVTCGNQQTHAYGFIRFSDYSFRNFWLTKPVTSDSWTFQSCVDVLPEHKARIISAVKKYMVKRGLK